MKPKRWSTEADADLRMMVSIGTKKPAIALQLDRSQGSVATRMATLGIYRRAADRELSKTAIDHIQAVERRLVKAASRAARAEAVHKLPPPGTPAMSGNLGPDREPDFQTEIVILPIDKVTLDVFRAGGRGWQKRINEALRKAADL